MLDHGNKSHRITMDQITNFAEALYMGEYGKGTIENYVRNTKRFTHGVVAIWTGDGVLLWKAQLIRSKHQRPSMLCWLVSIPFLDFSDG